MKEKDFIKLSLLDKTIDHDKIKNNILSKTEKPVPTRRQPLKSLAVTACLLLLTVSVVAVPLMLNNADEPILPAVNTESSTVSQEQSTAAQEYSTEVSSTDNTALDRKIVYGDDRNSEVPNIDYGYGNILYGTVLQNSMDAPENENALFHVRCDYISKKLFNEPEDLKYMQAEENYNSLIYELSRRQDDYAGYYKFYILEKIDFSTIPDDLENQYFDEHNIEYNKIINIKDIRKQELLYIDEDYNYKVKIINAAKMDTKTRNEVINQLDVYRKDIKKLIDKSYNAKKIYEELQNAKKAKLLEEYFERNGLNYSEILKKYGKLLLTKDEILSFTVNDQENLIIRLLPEVAEYYTIDQNLIKDVN